MFVRVVEELSFLNLLSFLFIFDAQRAKQQFIFSISYQNALQID